MPKLRLFLFLGLFLASRGSDNDIPGTTKIDFPGVARHAADRIKKTLPTSLHTGLHDTTFPEGILGVLCIAGGLILCFLGKRIFKLFLGIVGFLAGVLLAILGLSITGEQLNTVDPFHWIFVTVGGLALCILCFYVWKLAVYLTGTMGGFALSLYLCSILPAESMQDLKLRAAFHVAFTVAGAIAVVYLEDTILIIATGIAGALIACYGADLFNPESHFRSRIYQMAMTAVVESEERQMDRVITVFAIALAVTGVVVQFLTRPKKRAAGS